jgi:hypothetical protein
VEHAVGTSSQSPLVGPYVDSEQFSEAQGANKPTGSPTSPILSTNEDEAKGSGTPVTVAETETSPDLSSPPQVSPKTLDAVSRPEAAIVAVAPIPAMKSSAAVNKAEERRPFEVFSPSGESATLKDDDHAAMPAPSMGTSIAPIYMSHTDSGVSVITPAASDMAFPTLVSSATAENSSASTSPGSSFRSIPTPIANEEPPSKPPFDRQLSWISEPPPERATSVTRHRHTHTPEKSVKIGLGRDDAYLSSNVQRSSSVPSRRVTQSMHVPKGRPSLNVPSLPSLPSLFGDDEDDLNYVGGWAKVITTTKH